MLCTDMMPCSANTALKERECILDSIRMGVTDHINSLRVIDGLMFFGRHACSFDSPRIGWVIVSKNHFGVLADVLADILGERLSFHVFGVKQSQLAVTLPNPNDDFLVDEAAVSAGNMAPNEGLVHFDFSIKFRLIGFNHRSANSMAEIPRSLIAHSDSPLNLASGYSLFCFTEQCSRNEPLPKRQVGVMKDCARRYAELVMARVTVILKAIRNGCCGAIAARALCAIFPAQLLKGFSTFFVCSELLC